MQATRSPPQYMHREGTLRTGSQQGTPWHPQLLPPTSLTTLRSQHHGRPRNLPALRFYPKVNSFTGQRGPCRVAGEGGGHKHPTVQPGTH